MQQCPSLCLANGPDVNKGGGGIFRVTSSVPRPEEERAALIRVVTARVQDNKNTLPRGSRAEDRDRRPSSRFSRPGKIRIRTSNSNDDGSFLREVELIELKGREESLESDLKTDTLRTYIRWWSSIEVHEEREGPNVDRISRASLRRNPRSLRRRGRTNLT